MANRAFEASGFKIQSTADALLPQVPGEKSRFLERLLSQGRQEKLWDRQLSLLARFLQYQQDTFKSQCKAKSFRRRATQSFCEPVISSAPDQRVLGSQRSTRDFKRGPRVVVQAANQARHNGEGDLPAR